MLLLQIVMGDIFFCLKWLAKREPATANLFLYEIKLQYSTFTKKSQQIIILNRRFKSINDELNISVWATLV